VPVFNGAIKTRLQGGIKLVILRRFTQAITPILAAKSRQPNGVGT
jgi:hypothetical protein